MTPGVQMPHCSAACSRNFCWSGCNASPLASPSIVVTVRPSTSAASTRHDGTSRPSTSTEHAPQSPVVQPSFDPVTPTMSRSATSRLFSGSQRNSAGSPLIHVVTCSFAMSELPRTLGGDRGGPSDEHAGNRHAVRHGASLVVDRPRSGARGLSCLLQRRLVDRCADEGSSRVRNESCGPRGGTDTEPYGG